MFAVQLQVYTHKQIWLMLLNTFTLCEFAGSSTWRSATGTALNKKDIPGEMFGHAACAAGSRLLVLGGRQGRKFLRSLYILDTGGCRHL